jgi:hypothetical protein
MQDCYPGPTQAAGAALFRRNISGPIVMLNVLQFREYADYSGTPQLAPSTPITGRAAFGIYIAHTRPSLQRSGGELLLLANAGPWFIGPSDEHWDMAMLVTPFRTTDKSRKSHRRLR